MTTEPSQDKLANIFKWFVRILKCVVIAVILVTVGTAAFLYFNIYLPAGDGPAGPEVPAEPFGQIWSKHEVLLLGVGDSITDGFGASKGWSYFERLIRNPENDSQDMLGKNLSAVFPKLESTNIAVSGSVSSEHLKHIQYLKQQPPNVLGIVVMTTGGNDLIHDYGRSPPKQGAMYGATLAQAKPWIDNFEKRLEQMILHLKRVFPGGCHVFLANIYDPSDGTGKTNTWLTGLPPWPDGPSILKEYNKIISQCADKHNFVHLVDIHKTFLGHGIHCRKFWLKHYRPSDPHYWYHINIEDPSERGYDAIRRLFLIEMIKVLSGND